MYLEKHLTNYRPKEIHVRGPFASKFKGFQWAREAKISCSCHVTDVGHSAKGSCPNYVGTPARNGQVSAVLCRGVRCPNQNPLANSHT
jgi:putative transposon-encoded protein